MVPLNETIVKKEMLNAFNAITVECYQDMLRIKKPQPQAKTACQMLCKMVSSFRGGQQKHCIETGFSEWHTILDFVHRQPNLIKFNQEVTQLIQHMICSQDYLKQLRQNQLKNHLSKLIKI